MEENYSEKKTITQKYEQQRKKNEGKCAGINANRCLLTASLPFCSVIEYSVNVADDDKEKNLP